MSYFIFALNALTRKTCIKQQNKNQATLVYDDEISSSDLNRKSNSNALLSNEVLQNQVLTKRKLKHINILNIQKESSEIICKSNMKFLIAFFAVVAVAIAGPAPAPGVLGVGVPLGVNGGLVGSPLGLGLGGIPVTRTIVSPVVSKTIITPGGLGVVKTVGLGGIY
ncbi:hypothetical protein ACFFRR_010837 [Megaselia abdita]